MNGNDLTGNMILSIEDTLSAAEKNRTVDGAVKTQVQNAIKAARLALTAQMQKELADPSLSDKEKMAIQLRRGGSKPPKGKGESDSFFIYGPDGKPSAIFKPKEGENVKDGLPGGGAAREILTSKFNDLIKNSTGLDFGVAPTRSLIWKATNSLPARGPRTPSASAPCKAPFPTKAISWKWPRRIRRSWP